MKNDIEIIESLIEGGLIGATLGAIWSKKKGKGAKLGALAGAAILATYNANLAAKKTKLPLVFEENGSIYELQSNGVTRLIRTLEKSNIKLERKFSLQ
jgi:hypothetical protein